MLLTGWLLVTKKENAMNNKTIHQLAKLSRRIPRVRNRCNHKLRYAKGLSDAEVAGYRARLALLPRVEAMLKQELAVRRIGQPGIRCALPLRTQKLLVSHAGNETAAECRLLAGMPL